MDSEEETNNMIKEAIGPLAKEQGKCVKYLKKMERKRLTIEERVEETEEKQDRMDDSLMGAIRNEVGAQLGRKKDDG